EIEDLLLATDLSREEYVDNRVLRRGMRQPLSGAQRTVIWKVRDEMVEHMERTRALSRNWARIKLIRRLEKGGPEADGARDADLIFVDESQDLNTVDLKALKLLARRALIMAGDTDQSIYGIGSPYARAGVDISGRTRILHTNFRNTCAIHELAERYRVSAGEGRHDTSTTPMAFREGPVPELFTAPTADTLLSQLVERVDLFLNTLSYDPENVCVLCPTREEINRVGKALRVAGREAADIRAEDFSFQTTGAVRLCTVHSSKGLDFPVVLMYLPKLPMAGQYDERSADKLLRNLVYVGMTRAMDNLAVFALRDAAEPALRDLVAVWGEGGGE
ncbi:MAG: UvrD-helicase domain-containing protein, partial [Phycisphaeraceae bacterium]|nr:UvrD-helicase domain-containing protein [Phycisphaeraceae bacterium]